MADIPTDYLLIIIAFGILAFGMFIKEYAIAAIGSFFVMLLGIYIIIYNLNGVNDWLTQGLGIIMIGIGAYVVIRGGYEAYKDL